MHSNRDLYLAFHFRRMPCKTEPYTRPHVGLPKRHIRNFRQAY
jgi:hypothetical protein